MYYYRYPTSNQGQLKMPTIENTTQDAAGNNSAVIAVKAAIEDLKQAKKMRNKKKKV